MSGVQIIKFSDIAHSGSNPMIDIRELFAAPKILHGLIVKRAHLKAGAEVHNSVHPDQDELLYVAAGAITFQADDDDPFLVEPDTLLYIPAGTAHGYMLPDTVVSADMVAHFWSLRPSSS